MLDYTAEDGEIEVRISLSKQEFDIEARKLLSGSSSKIQLHNMFLLYLFRKCQGLASSPIQPQHSHHSSKTSGRISSNSSSKNKDQRHSRSDKVAFEPADILDYAYVAKTSTKHTEEPPIRYCAQELFIPNTSLIMGRLLLATWEHELEGADDKCADILGVAVKLFLKTILMTIISRKKGFKLRNEKVLYKCGSSVANPWVCNTVNLTTKRNRYNVEEMDDSDCEDVPLSTEKIEDYEHKALYELACGSVSYTVQRPICTWDLLETFTMNPELLPSHTVNSMNLARVLSRLHHNSYEDMDEIGS
uniref:Transcriptional adapter 1 n=1 Tax=Timema cristinae TaxID=61476 RepID=A0A7R9CRB9_TIMCR|nr:unnamed protein product [Timema cristinae]